MVVDGLDLLRACRKEIVDIMIIIIMTTPMIR